MAKTPRLHLVIAFIMAGFGALRFLSDMLTDASPDWYLMLQGTVFRYLVRAPSDGTLPGYLSVQWVKLLSVPCGISGLFLLYRFLSANLRESQYRWQMIERRLLYVLGLLAAFTLMEIEKATHIFGLRMAGLLAGEQAWLNHLLHLVSAFIGWFYIKWLKLDGNQH